MAGDPRPARPSAARHARRALGHARRLAGDRPAGPGRPRGAGPAGAHPRRRAPVATSARRAARRGCATRGSRRPSAHRPPCRGLHPAPAVRVAICGGTTTARSPARSPGATELTIVTNSLTIAMEIASRPQPQGRHDGRRPALRSRFELVGVLAENTFNAINVGTAILGTDGISAAGGATTHDETEARTNNAMVTPRAAGDRGRRRRPRSAASPSPRWPTIVQVDMLVTDSTADPDELARSGPPGSRC